MWKFELNKKYSINTFEDLKELSRNIVYSKVNATKYKRSCFFRRTYIYANVLTLLSSLILCIIFFFIITNKTVGFVLIGTVVASSIFVVVSSVFFSGIFISNLFWKYKNNIPIQSKGVSLISVYDACVFCLDEKNELVRLLFKDIYSLDNRGINNSYYFVHSFHSGGEPYGNLEKIQLERIEEIANKYFLTIEEVARVFKQLITIKTFLLERKHIKINKEQNPNYVNKDEVKIMNTNLFYLIITISGFIWLLLSIILITIWSIIFRGTIVIR